jgi:hypothetical protein
VAFNNQRKRNWIRRIFDKAVEEHVSFSDQIASERNAAVDANIAGEFASISGNGVSSTFAQAGMSPGDAETLIGEIEDLYTKAVTDLANQSTPVEEPSDTQIRDTMLLIIGSGRITTVYNNFSGMRP